MVIGVLQFEVLVDDAGSIKDKRRVVSSLKDRLHREHLASVAEVGRLESHSVAVMALAIVGNDGAHIGRVLDQITAKLRAMTDARLGDVTRELLHGLPDARDAGDPPVAPPARVDDSFLARITQAEALGPDRAVDA